MEIININNFLEKKDPNEIIQLLDDKNNFDLFTNIILDQFESINDNKLELVIKIILTIIIKFDGDIKSENLKTFYSKFENTKGTNLDLLNNFISLYDNINNFKTIFISLNFQLVNIFRKKFKAFDEFYKKEKLSKKDFKNIKNLIENDILTYYNAFFENSYSNTFFKRITDCKNKVTQDIHTEEIMIRLRTLNQLFTLEFTEKLGIEKITIGDFLMMDYNDRVRYYRLYYSKTCGLFKNYFKLDEKISLIEEKLEDLIKIDPLNYIDALNDSTSSFIISDDHLEIEMSKFEENNKFLEFNFENTFEEIEYEDSSSEDDKADTPFIKIYEGTSNIDESKGNSNSSSESYGETSESSSDEEISDIFVKKKD